MPALRSSDLVLLLDILRSGDEDVQNFGGDITDDSVLLHRSEIKAPPACAVTDRRSRTGATGGVSRSSNRLSTVVVLHKCC